MYRGVEIKQYLDEHQEIENYVILDDDSDMLLSQKDHFIKTDSESGISEEDVKRAIEILNKTSCLGQIIPETYIKGEVNFDEALKAPDDSQVK